MIGFIVTAIGCGPDGPQKVLVTGRVQYNGEPLKLGRIHFHPVEGTSGPVSSAAISDGNYRIDNKGGVPVGRHRVQIEGYRKATVAAPGLDLSETAADQYVPTKYNSTSELTTEIKEGESAAVRNFDLTD